MGIIAMINRIVFKNVFEKIQDFFKTQILVKTRFPINGV